MGIDFLRRQMMLRCVYCMGERSTIRRSCVQESRWRNGWMGQRGMLGDRKGTSAVLGSRLRIRKGKWIQNPIKAEDEPHALTEAVAESTTEDSADLSGNSVHNGGDVSKSSDGQTTTWSQLLPERVRSFWMESVAMEYLKESFHVLWRNLWTLMSLTALNSVARFVLVWTLYKTVCAVAVQFFGIPVDSIPQEMIPTTGSSGDPNVYQQLADITFLLFKPFDFLLKGIFVAAGLLVCWETANTPNKAPEGPKQFRLIRRMWRGFLKSFTSSWQSLKSAPHYMPIYIVVGGMTALYQGLCLLLIPLLSAMRRLMNIQLTLCVSLLQGKKLKESLAESTSLIEPIRKHLYFPYLLLFLTPKALGFARDFVVKAFPDRLFVDVPEITWGLIALTTVMAFLVDRMAEIFSIVIYSTTHKQTKTIQN